MDQEYQGGQEEEYDENLQHEQGHDMGEEEGGEEYGEHGGEEGMYGEEEDGENPEEHQELGEADPESHWQDPQDAMPDQYGMPQQQGMPQLQVMPQQQGMPQPQGTAPPHIGDAQHPGGIPPQLQPQIEQLLHLFMDLLHQHQHVPSHQQAGEGIHPDLHQTYLNLYQGLTELKQQVQVLEIDDALHKIEAQLQGMPDEEEGEQEHALSPELQQLLQEMQQQAGQMSQKSSAADGQGLDPIPPRPQHVDPHQMWQGLTAPN